MAVLPLMCLVVPLESMQTVHLSMYLLGRHVIVQTLTTGVALLLWLQVMLAQQRTIIQLVELVNVLHGEAASLVSKLTGQQPVTPTELQHMQQQPQQLDQAGDEGCDRQLAADQQLVQERWVWVAGSGCP